MLPYASKLVWGRVCCTVLSIDDHVGMFAAPLIPLLPAVATFLLASDNQRWLTLFSHCSVCTRAAENVTFATFVLNFITQLSRLSLSVPMLSKHEQANTQYQINQIQLEGKRTY